MPEIERAKVEELVERLRDLESSSAALYLAAKTDWPNGYHSGRVDAFGTARRLLEDLLK
jgi:hypothetical protein